MLKLLPLALVVLHLSLSHAGYPGSYYAYRSRAGKKGGASSYQQYVNYHEPAPYKEYDDEAVMPVAAPEMGGGGAGEMGAEMMGAEVMGAEAMGAEAMGAEAMGAEAMGAGGGEKSGNGMGGNNGGAMGGKSEGGKYFRGGQGGSHSYMSRTEGSASSSGDAEASGGAEGMQGGEMAEMTGAAQEQGVMGMGGGGQQQGEANIAEGEQGEGFGPEYLYVLHAVASPIKIGYGWKIGVGKKAGVRSGYRGKGNAYSVREGGEEEGMEMGGGEATEGGEGAVEMRGAGGMMGEAGGMMMQAGMKVMGGRQGGGMGMMERGGGMMGMEVMGGAAMGGGEGVEAQGGGVMGEEGGMSGAMMRMEQGGMMGMVENNGNGGGGGKGMAYGGGGKAQSYSSGAIGTAGGFESSKLILGQGGMGEFRKEYYAPAYYLFRYGVEDHKTGDFKKHHEVRDKDGTRGFYSLLEPDGSIRVVHYTASKHSGFNAVVEKRGRSKHPSDK